MGTRVLLVDDHASFRRLARRTLEVGGFEVVGEACTGAEAVALALRLQPQAVLLDILLPDIDGVEVARRLAGLTVPPAVVLCSSRPREDYGSRLADSPALGFITKEDLTPERLAALFG